MSVSECLCCSDGAATVLTTLRDDSTLNLCQDCWADRHRSGFVEELAANGLLTPRVVAELQSHFYDVTSPHSDAEFTDVAAAFLTDITHVTTIRTAPESELAQLRDAPDGTAFSDVWRDVKQPMGLSPDEMGDAILLFPPVGEDYPVYVGVYLIGESLDDLNSALADYGIDIT